MQIKSSLCPTLATTNKLSSKLDTHPIFYCGCNCILQNRDEFKSHVQHQHNSEFIQGSSHFLTFTTSIVLPVKCWKQESIEFFKSTSFRLQENTNIEKSILKTQNKMSNLKEKSQIVGQSRRNKKNDNKNKDLEASQLTKKNDTVQKEFTVEDKRIPLQWNQFLLIPNQKYPHCQFYCGKCQMQLPNIQKFIFHCFDQCQELEHPKSSHRIDMKKEKEEKNIEQKQLILQNQLKDKDPLQLMKISLLQSLNDDEKFVCGCGKFSNFRRTNNIYHHLMSHGQVLPQNSSHVIIRRKKFSSLNFFLSFLREGNEEENNKDLYCPCKPDRIMKRNELVLHIRKVHKGVSPKYC